MARTKVSVTIDADLVERAERASGGRSRSAVFEEALGLWLRRQREQTLVREIEAYYRARTDEEIREDEVWARLGDEAAKDWE